MKTYLLILLNRVYEFLGVPGLEASSMPPIGKLVPSRLGYFIRHGKHEVLGGLAGHS